MMLLVLLTFASLILTGNALDVQGRIIWNSACSVYKDLGKTRVVLDNGKFGGGVTQEGAFSIPNVSTGTYILSVLAHDHGFEQLRVDVLDESNVEVRPYVPGTPLNPASTILLPYPITLSAKQKFNYFVPPESFNIMGMLGSPMMLMMLFAGGMVLAMPYLMKNMDPEALEDMKEQQAKMAKMQSAMASGDFKSGFSALMSGFEEPSQAGAKAQPATGNTKKKSTKKR
ncbi:secreted salivary protein [Moniliophthora roreri MCA 2997]|nr:secreted salivary protein [Moniliophthora roreri MCA 2997]KAI3621905.1 secreted salivary protein [Moniliophthora roreri]